jgi:hypothetical protein
MYGRRDKDMKYTIENASYWSKRNTDLDAAATDDVAYAQSYSGRLEAAQRRLNLVTSDQIAYTDADRQEALNAIAMLQAEADAAFATTWTLAVTIARRAEWNALVRSGVFGKTKADVRKVTDQERRQGWTIEQLKRAVALHKL